MPPPEHDAPAAEPSRRPPASSRGRFATRPPPRPRAGRAAGSPCRAAGGGGRRKPVRSPRARGRVRRAADGTRPRRQGGCRIPRTPARMPRGGRRRACCRETPRRCWDHRPDRGPPEGARRATGERSRPAPAPRGPVPRRSIAPSPRAPPGLPGSKVHRSTPAGFSRSIAWQVPPPERVAIRGRFRADFSRREKPTFGAIREDPGFVVENGVRVGHFRVEN